jgi:hypothetical protein
MLRQLEPATVLTRFQGIAEASSELVRTDIPQSMVGTFSDLGVLSRERPLNRLEIAPPLIDNARPDFALIRASVAEAVAPPASAAP